MRSAGLPINLTDFVHCSAARLAIASSSGEGSRRKPETCNQVFDRFIAHCELRVSKEDMALSTLNGYREILDRVFRPEIGEDSFEGVLYSRLAEVVADNTQDCKKKTYNNITSAVRTAFTFGYEDRPGKTNPALSSIVSNHGEGSPEGRSLHDSRCGVNHRGFASHARGVVRKL